MTQFLQDKHFKSLERILPSYIDMISFLIQNQIHSDTI
jgi:hypothetical protein